ncbi:MAG: cell division protein ZapA [Myxococcota bacterium]|nr:cell division protein ZapA [Myxococcota bacterium]
MVGSPQISEKKSRDKRNVKVELYGQRFSIRTDDDEEYIQKLSNHINRKMQEIRNATGRVETSQIALLALLEMSDTLFRERAKVEQLRGEVMTKSNTLLQAIDEISNTLELTEDAAVAVASAGITGRTNKK